jgi:hypothetical protein
LQTRQLSDSFTAMLKLSAQLATGACCALWRPVDAHNHLALTYKPEPESNV